MPDDRIRVQVQFKKLLWICPSCSHEEWEDRPMGGGASYIHTCSKCSAEFNSTGGNSKEYNGTVNYTPEEYEKVAEVDLSKAKQDLADAWIYSVKNPPTPVEPTKQDYENLYKERMEEAQRYLTSFAEKATEAELTALKTEAVSRVDSVVKVVEVVKEVTEETEIKG